MTGPSDRSEDFRLDELRRDLLYLKYRSRVRKHRRMFVNWYILLVGIAIVLWIYGASGILDDLQRRLVANFEVIRETPVIFHVAVVAIALGIIWYEDQNLGALFMLDSSGNS